MKSLEDLIKELPPARREAVRAFVEALLKSESHWPLSKPTLEWGGALRHLRDRYTSVELQHEVARSRSTAE